MPSWYVLIYLPAFLHDLVSHYITARLFLASISVSGRKFLNMIRVGLQCIQDGGYMYINLCKLPHHSLRNSHKKGLNFSLHGYWLMHSEKTFWSSESRLQLTRSSSILTKILPAWITRKYLDMFHILLCCPCFFHGNILNCLLPVIWNCSFRCRQYPF